MIAEKFWFLMTIAVLVWYSTITIYVAIRGTFDVKHMLRSLAEKDRNRNGRGAPDHEQQRGFDVIR
jgi:hypothetical protein